MDIPDTSSMNLQGSTDYDGRLIVELWGSDQVPDRSAFGERSEMEHAYVAGVMVPSRQVSVGVP